MKINELLESADDIELKAKILAIDAHKNQKYGVHPYVTHLADVVARVKTITQDPEIIAAAWLHDIVEDTDVTLEQIKQQFGDNVANIVWAVTGRGENRKEKMANAIAKIAQTPGSELVKSADRLSNVSASLPSGLANNPKKLKMYRDEHKDLSPVLGNNALALELVDLFK
jgi:(p)ppGpp synthase/HD superfamily hydrolase